MKKKLFSLLLCSAVMMSGCAKNTSDTTTDHYFPESVSDGDIVTELSVGKARTEYDVLLRTLSGGEEFTMIGEYGNRYIVDLNDVKGVLVDKHLVITSVTTSVVKRRTAYAKNNAMLFESPQMTGTMKLLPINTVLTVTEELNGIAIVEYDGNRLFISTDDISEKRLSSKKSESVDGGDISLSCADAQKLNFVGSHMHGMVETSLKFPCSGKAFCDGVEAYLWRTEEGQPLQVSDCGEKSCTVYNNISFGNLPRWAVIMSDDEYYAPWTAYAKANAPLYYNEYLKGDGIGLKVNSELKVIYELQGGICVAIYNGRFAFTEICNVSKERITVKNSDIGDWTPPSL